MSVANTQAPFVVVASPVRGTTLRRVSLQHWRAASRGHPACVCFAFCWIPTLRASSTSRNI